MRAYEILLVFLIFLSLPLLARVGGINLKISSSSTSKEYSSNSKLNTMHSIYFRDNSLIRYAVVKILAKELHEQYQLWETKRLVTALERGYSLPIEFKLLLDDIRDRLIIITPGATIRMESVPL